MILTHHTMFELLQRDDVLTKKIDDVDNQIVDGLHLAEESRDQYEKAAYQKKSRHA